MCCRLCWIGYHLKQRVTYSLFLEARVGFEPTNGGFADLSLGPLGYRAKLFSIANTQTRVKAMPQPPNSQHWNFIRFLADEKTFQAFADSSIPCSSFPGLNRTALPGGIFTS